MSKTPTELMLDQVKWELVEDKDGLGATEGIPHVTHQGVLDIAGFKLRVYQLSNGKRIIEENDFAEFFENMARLQRPEKAGGGTGNA